MLTRYALVAALTLRLGDAACVTYSARFDKELEGICVCNATHCPEISNDYQSLTGDQVGVYQTSRAGDRLVFSTLQATALSANDTSVSAVLEIDSSKTYQKIKGFGGAFTDATALNVYKLQPELQQRAIDAYFGENGIQYTLGRVPIGSTDFSTYIYSYNPVEGDLEMENFSIDVDKSNETYKLDFIKRVLNATSRELPLFVSSWAPPAWMTQENKTQNSHIIGEPGGPYWKALALYYSRFFDEYKKEGVNFWAMSTQNEPHYQLGILAWQQLRFNHTTERDFIKKDLGPLMKKNHPEVKIIMMDDQKDLLPEWNASLVDPEAKQYVSGIGVHWYKNLDFVSDLLGDFDKLSEFHEKHPDIFILATEACAGSMPDGLGTGRATKMLEPDVMWQRAENYARDIINDLANYAVGWVDWNMVLDTKGGPSWVGNNVDAPILVDEANGTEFYLQGLYYVMGHFSKFLTPNSTRVDLRVAANTSQAIDRIDRVAFLSPQGQLAVVLSNRNNQSLELTLRDTIGKRDLRVALPANAVQTVLFAAAGGASGGSTSAPSTSAGGSPSTAMLTLTLAGVLALCLFM